MYIPGMGFVKDLGEKGVKTAVSDKIEETTRAVMAGIGLKEIRAILRGDPPTEKPNPRYKAQIKSFMLHVRPKFYQEGSTWFTHTFRMGLFSFLFFLIETITGLILMVFYTPAPEIAYFDMINILTNVNLGKFWRDFHRLGAELMVVTVTLHMMRVYFTGSYKHPRQFTWLTGMVLLLLTLFLSFSGYLLPWDQLSLWAVTIGTSMADAAPMIGYEVNLLLRGSNDIGAGGLLRFYLLHIFFLPLLAIVFISIHYYKVSREHSISLPAPIEEGMASASRVKSAKKKINFIPDLMTAELMWSLIGIAVTVVAIVFFYSAKIEHHANTLKTPLHTAAPWYFLWLQGMLKFGDKTWWGVVWPTVIFLVLFAVPYIDPGKSRLAKNRKVGIFVGVFVTLVIVVLNFMGTGLWGVKAPAAVELVQEFLPEEGVGVVREIPYDKLIVGEYNTNDSSTFPEGQLGVVLEELKQAVERESAKTDNNFYDGNVTVTIQDWQTNLKRLDVVVLWKEVPEGSKDKTERSPNDFPKVYFLHSESNYTLLEWKIR